MYENTVAQYGGGDPAIVPIYPFEGTFVATHPACVSDSAPADQQGRRCLVAPAELHVLILLETSDEPHAPDVALGRSLRRKNALSR